MKRSISLQLVAFVAIRVVLNTMIRMVYPYSNAFASGLNIDIKTLSLGVTLRSIAGAFGPFLAFFADNRGRKFGMLFGLSLFTVGTGLMALWPTYPIFILTLILTLLGNLVFIPAMQAYLGDRVPYRRRGRALAISELGWSLSFIIGVPLVGLLISRAGWQAPFPVLTLLGILSIVVLLIMLPKDVATQAGANSLLHNMRQVFTYAPAVAGLLMGASMSAANELVNLTFGVWMADTFAVSIAALAVASLVIGLSELGGEGLVGLFADDLGKARAVGIGLALNSLAALALPLIGQSLTGGLVGLFLFYFTFEFTIVSGIPLMTEVLPSARATLMATWIASISLGRALGAFLAPWLYTAKFTSGMTLIVAATVGFNILAYLALRRVKINRINEQAAGDV